MITATDNVSVANVDVVFDVNGNNDTSDPGERLVASQVSANTYQVTFGNISGPPGNRTIRAFATDPAGNLGITLLTVSVTSGGAVAVLAVSKSHSTNFAQGQNNATYAVIVSNSAGAGPTSGSVTVTDTIPSGLTLVSMVSTGWSCSVNTCSRSDILNGGASYPAITVTVSVASNAPSTVTNTVSVAGGGSVPASANDPTTITPNVPALALTKAHSGTFVQGQINATYTVVVSNGVSAGPTNGLVTVTDTIPTGLTLVSVAGTGWSCSTNTCIRSDALNGGVSYPPMTVTVNVAGNAPASVANLVTVTGGGSAAASANDPTIITTASALSITNTHNGSFAQGQNGATYTLVVSNGPSAGATNGVVSVTDTILSGLTLVGMAGTGWSCTGNTCTRSDVLNAGSSYSAITVTVNVAGSAPATVTNVATVSGGGSATSSASAPTAIGALQIVWLGGGHTGGINRVIAASNGNIWTAANDKTIKQWRLADMTLLRTVQIDYTSLAPAAISRDGQRAAAAGSAGLGFYQLPAGTQVCTYSVGGGGYPPQLSPDGQKILFERSSQLYDT